MVNVQACTAAMGNVCANYEKSLFFLLREEQEPILEVGHHNQSAIINKWVIHHFSNMLYSVFLQFNSSMCTLIQSQPLRAWQHVSSRLRAYTS